MRPLGLEVADLVRMAAVLDGGRLWLLDRAAIVDSKPRQGVHFCLSVQVRLACLQARSHLSRIKSLSRPSTMLEPICLKRFSILLISQKFANLLRQSDLLQLITKFDNKFQTDLIV